MGPNMTGHVLSSPCVHPKTKGPTTPYNTPKQRRVSPTAFGLFGQLNTGTFVEGGLREVKTSSLRSPARPPRAPREWGGSGGAPSERVVSPIPRLPARRDAGAEGGTPL